MADVNDRLERFLDQHEEDQREGFTIRALSRKFDLHDEKDDRRFDEHGRRLSDAERKLAYANGAAEERKIRAIEDSRPNIRLPSPVPHSTRGASLLKLLANPKMIPVYIALASTCSYMVGHVHGVLSISPPAARALPPGKEVP